MRVLNEGYTKRRDLFVKGIGSKIADKNNNFYIDLTGGGGTSLLGHNNNIFKTSIEKFIKKKISNFALPNLHTIDLSTNIKKVLPQFDKFIFCNSGAEANMKAIRIARSITKKDKIASVSGSWHGSLDQFLFSCKNNGSKIPLSDGLEKNIEKKIIYIPYDNFKRTKEILDRNKKLICCVIFEPIQGCLPTENNDKYLIQLSNYCKKNQIILILDEIITGLRTDCSSVQNKYKLSSDISTFGKAFGNGLPIGIIGVTKKISKKIKKNKIPIYFGGTFSGNSLCMFVANESLTFIIKNKSRIFKDLEEKSSYFCKEIDRYIVENSINTNITRFKSVIRIIFSKKKPKDRLQRDFFEKKNNSKRLKFIDFLKKNKIIYPKNGIIFFTTSIKKKDIDYILKKIKQGLIRYFK